MWPQFVHAGHQFDQMQRRLPPALADPGLGDVVSAGHHTPGHAGNVLLQPSVTALISKRAVDGQGAAMGLNNSFQALGRATGPLWAGFAFDLTSTLSFWTGALVQGIALFYAMRRLPALQSSPPSEPVQVQV